MRLARDANWLSIIAPEITDFLTSSGDCVRVCQEQEFSAREETKARDLEQRWWWKEETPISLDLA